MLTAERLKQLVSYDQETGIFTRIERRTNSLTLAGSKRKTGYLSVFIDGRSYPAHRLAWFYVYGEWPQLIDHRNGNKADNRIANLRPATNSENLQNRNKASSNSSSGILGAYFHCCGKWQARIQINGRARSLGLYATKEEAGAAYARAKSVLHPFCEMPQAVHV